jgi:general secretion pathway protein L
MQRTLTQTFPNVKVVVDAPVQMEREIAALRQATGATSGRDLEAMLAALTAAVPPERAITGIDYSNGELRVRGLGLGADELRNVAAAMKTRGYKASLNGDILVVTQELQS